MIRIFFVFFVLYTLIVSAAIPLDKIQAKCGDPKDFNAKQKKIILYAYNYGSTNGLGYTMAAISWQESCAGEYMVNFSDPSAGIYHAHIPGVIKKYTKYKDTSFVRNLIGELLMRDNEFASRVALDNLLFWQKNRKGNYKDIIKSYNKGFSWEKSKNKNKSAEAYYQDIRMKVLKLRSYIPKYSKALNNSLKIELEDKNQNIKNTLKDLQDSKKQQKIPVSKPIKKDKVFIMPEP